MSLTNVCCAVFDCEKNVQNKGTRIHYYNFPNDPNILQKWINSSTWKQGFDIKTAKICSRHFSRDSFGTKYKLVNPEMKHLCSYVEILKEDAVPTLHLCKTEATLHSELFLSDDDKSLLVPTLFQPDDSSEPNVTEASYSNTTNINRTLINEKYEMLQLEIRGLNASILSGKKKMESLKGKIKDIQQNIDRVENIYQQKNLKYQELKASRGDMNEEMDTAEDDEILRRVFSESQRHIITGKRKIHWSADDLAVAYTLRHMGNKRCYNYITKNLKIPLPALSSIKRWAYLECKK